MTWVKIKSNRTVTLSFVFGTMACGKHELRTLMIAKITLTLSVEYSIGLYGYHFT